MIKFKKQNKKQPYKPEGCLLSDKEYILATKIKLHTWLENTGIVFTKIRRQRILAISAIMQIALEVLVNI